uniref:TBC1 domain family, member 7 n=1 Tax=Salmo trutta TaxID=8032 RepID=A0A673YAH3_SALTR
MKVGFRGVEDNKSLEILMKENPLGTGNMNIGLLPHLQHYTVDYIPSSQLPVYHASSLQHYTVDYIPSSQLPVHHASRLPFHSSSHGGDRYWLIKRFVNQFNNKFGDSIPHLCPKSLEHYLSVEEPRLLNHLKNTGALAMLPYSLWFRRCFAGCPSLVIRGSCKILVFVYVEIFLSYKISLKPAANQNDLPPFSTNHIDLFCFLLPLAGAQENTDAIVTKAIDLWHPHALCIESQTSRSPARHS